jgi:hypothetical protein
MLLQIKTASASTSNTPLPVLRNLPAAALRIPSADTPSAAAAYTPSSVAASLLRNPSVEAAGTAAAAAGNRCTEVVGKTVVEARIGT